ncbi:aldehyde dehydrogenase family protein [Desulfobacula sp.]|uniref:aldehyde dehydrogenase family protein n=1 Tax=Desulfobacula sp. TaxID=2593537 RepID=UPI00260E51F3|nr:aldehyde dehydrogenase family protein [Desulfobacula sp.]
MFDYKLIKALAMVSREGHFDKAPLTAIAIQNIIAPVVDKYGIDGIFNLVIGNRQDVGGPMLHDRRIPLISATGSTAMGNR